MTSSPCLAATVAKHFDKPLWPNEKSFWGAFFCSFRFFKYFLPFHYWKWVQFPFKDTFFLSAPKFKNHEMEKMKNGHLLSCIWILKLQLCQRTKIQGWQWMLFEIFMNVHNLSQQNPKFILAHCGFQVCPTQNWQKEGILRYVYYTESVWGAIFSKGGLSMSIWIQVLKMCIISSKITLNLTKVYGNLLGGRTVGHPPTPHFIFKKWAILEPIESRIHINSVWALKFSWPHHWL